MGGESVTGTEFYIKSTIEIILILQNYTCSM